MLGPETTSGKRCRRATAVAFVALLVLLGGCASMESPPPLRVMTYNVRHGEGMDGVIDLARIAAVIAAAEPDAVALQEIDVNTMRSGEVDQVAALARLAGFEHYAFGRFMDYDGGQYGMAILSRHPIESSRVIPLPPGEHEPRTSLLAEIARPGAPFVLVGVHFDWLDDDAARFEQAQALVEAMAAETRSFVIAGDFNDAPGSRTVDLLDRVWTRIPKASGAAWTFPSDGPRQEIDLVYAGGALNPPTGLARVLDERVASDHRPVVATITW